MKKNDIFELEITDMGVDGEGIGKYEGMTFFVKDALIGDIIRARATKLKKNYGYARVEEIIEPSPHRTDPPCELHRRCGGCQIQALDYKEQLSFKEKKVRNNLMRIGGFSEELLDKIMEPAVGMEEPFRYRNKAQFPVGYDKNGELVAGFYAARTHSIIPVSDCLIGAAENRPVLELILDWMRENNIPAYDENDGSGLVRHILIRKGFTTEELMVCLVINGNLLPCQDQLIEALTKIDGMTSISFNINLERTNVILGKKTKCIWGMPYITDYINLRNTGDFSLTDTAIAYHISPQSFYQINPVQTEKLYSTALDYAALTGKESVWDLYCGIGTISLFLSQKARQVYGVEIVPQAIEDAKNNAKLNHIDNAEFFVGKAEEVLPKFYAGNLRENSGSLGSAGNYSCEDQMTPGTVGGVSHEDRMTPDPDAMRHPDVIVVDPPRKGCDEICLSTMLGMKPERIVYISCDSATLARDLKILCEGGYAIERIRPFDLFPHSGHVETVVKLVNIGVKPDFTVRLEVDVDDFYKTVGEEKRHFTKPDQKNKKNS